MTSKYLTIPAVVAGALGLTAVAQAAEPTVAELQQQIARLQSQVEQMDQASRNATMARDVDATVASVLKDADSRSKLLAMEGMTAGHDGNSFVLASTDGKYKLRPKFQFQARSVFNYVDDDNDNRDDWETGAEIRRMKFEASGNAVSEDLTYKFRVETDHDGGGVSLEDAWVQYQFADQWALRTGQFKDPVHHEELVSSGYQLAVDRSLVNELIGGGQTDYVQGIGLVYTSDQIQGIVVLHDGYNTDNTNYQDVGGTSFIGITDVEWGLSGRIEFAAAGNFKDYEKFSSFGKKEDLLVIGVGVDWSASDDNSVVFHTIDAQWNSGPLAVYGALLGLYTQFDDGTVDEDYYHWGAVAQVGYMLNDEWEIFGRGGYLEVDDDFVTASGEDNGFELTVGVNRYMWGSDRAKFSADVTWLPDGSPVDVDGIGVSATGEDSFIFRTQFQLLI